MIVFIYLCILALNIVTILLTYHFLGKEMEKKQKGIFVIVGIAAMYLFVSFIYWISTNGIDLGTNHEIGKNLITFTFVPVNGMVILPFLANSYQHFKANRLKAETFRNRCILLSVILVIVLIIEFFYFKDIQNGILSMLQSATNK